MAGEQVDTAVFDVDGTLVDTNYQHALSWYRAFRRFDIVLPVWRLHRAIGMGGDNLVAHVAGQDVEDRLGEELRSGWEEEFNRLVPEASSSWAPSGCSTPSKSCATTSRRHRSGERAAPERASPSTRPVGSWRTG